MLNLFQSAMSNESNDDQRRKSTKKVKDDNSKQEIALKEYSGYYGQVAISPSKMIYSNKNTNNNNKEKDSKAAKSGQHRPPLTTLDLAFQRFLSAYSFRNNGLENTKTTTSLMDDQLDHAMKFISDYTNQDKPLYELDHEKIGRSKKDIGEKISFVMQIFAKDRQVLF
jgi:hypothetical protein